MWPLTVHFSLESVTRIHNTLYYVGDVIQASRKVLHLLTCHPRIMLRTTPSQAAACAHKAGGIDTSSFMMISPHTLSINRRVKGYIYRVQPSRCMEYHQRAFVRQIVALPPSLVSRQWMRRSSEYWCLFWLRFLERLFHVQTQCSLSLTLSFHHNLSTPSIPVTYQ